MNNATGGRDVRLLFLCWVERFANAQPHEPAAVSADEWDKENNQKFEVVREIDLTHWYPDADRQGDQPRATSNF